MNKADELKKKLVLVQAMGGVAWSALRKSNFDMYEHIAEIFFGGLKLVNKKDIWMLNMQRLVKVLEKQNI